MFQKKNEPAELDQGELAGEAEHTKKPNWIKISIIANLVFFGLILAAGGTGFVIHKSDTNPQFCGSCHLMQNNVDSYLNGNTLDHVHAEADVQCKECHADYSLVDEISAGFKFITASYTIVSADNPHLPKMEYEDEMCLRCHISNEYLADQTDFLVRNPHLNHWTSLNCSDCHISHGEQIDYCGECHDNGGQRLTGDPIIPRVDNPWASGEDSASAPSE